MLGNYILWSCYLSEMVNKKRTNQPITIITDKKLTSDKVHTYTHTHSQLNVKNYTDREIKLNKIIVLPPPQQKNRKENRNKKGTSKGWGGRK